MLVPALQNLSGLLALRLSVAPGHDEQLAARQLKGHVDDFLIPRALDVESPLLVVILGSTGSGKSSLFNTIAGEKLSEVGVLRPTTRRAHALVDPDNRLPPAIDQMVEDDVVDVIRHQAGLKDLVVVDAPDFDSIEAANRLLARRLLEAADLIIFTTTDTRYADEMPWAVLRRAGERGLPVLAVINRLPRDPGDRVAVIGDFRRLLEQGELGGLDPSGVEVVGVELGELDVETSGLRREAAAPVIDNLHRLVANDEQRRELVRAALNRALADLPRAVDEIAAGIEAEALVRDRLLETVVEAYEASKSEIDRRVDRGSFLRSEVLREWQDFVGANRVARVISDGVGKVAATVRSAFRPGPPPPAPEVREAAFADLIALVTNQADHAASETAARWARDHHGSDALEGDPHLWGASPGFELGLHEKLAGWGAKITREIMEVGEKRRGVAKAASLGVNVVGTGAILAVFAQTGGLTGAEAGIAAVTAVVNQTLLEAIFGEANVARFVTRARASLDEIIDESLVAEAERFADAVALSPELHQLAHDLREAAASVEEASQ